jgi:hypothetical protein
MRDNTALTVGVAPRSTACPSFVGDERDDDWSVCDASGAVHHGSPGPGIMEILAIMRSPQARTIRGQIEHSGLRAALVVGKWVTNPTHPGLPS